MNRELALHIVRELGAAGVTEICLCAGARNSPLVEAFAVAEQFQKFHFFEERSAAFFALGRIKAEGRPVAVMTTSGTAAAELLPATIEAYYSGLPLVLVTADRPRDYRGTAAPQSIEQVGLFGSYAKPAFDLAGDERAGLAGWEQCGPVHLNVCFEEPLLGKPFQKDDFVFETRSEQLELRDCSAARAELQDFLRSFEKPLVILGELPREARAAVEKFLLELGAPIYAEAASGLRESARLAPLQIRSTDRIFSRLGQMKEPVTSVLRIGGVPTLRFWRDLETVRTDLPVLSVSELPFSGSTRSKLLEVSLAGFFEGFELSLRKERFDFTDLLSWDRDLYAAILKLLQSEPRSEAGMVHALSRRIAAGSGVFLGNSLPIREWDLAAVREKRDFEIGVNRGANGIDGQVSTCFGFAKPGRENWALLGDLTAMYDLAAPWILSQLPQTTVRLVVMNNGGGQIFSRMFTNPVFQNRHQVGFESWAGMWKLPYLRCEDVASLSVGDDVAHALIELRPDPAATERFWVGYDRVCKVDF